VDASRLWVSLKDGREISVPLAWFDWLASADEAARQDFRILEGGSGIWWETIDEGLSVPGLFGLSESP
jgi:hypothetical protein